MWRAFWSGSLKKNTLFCCPHACALRSPKRLIGPTGFRHKIGCSIAPRELEPERQSDLTKLTVSLRASASRSQFVIAIFNDFHQVKQIQMGDITF